MDEPLPWFGKFAVEHIARNPHHGFPRYSKSDTTAVGKAGNEAFVAYFGTWKRAFLMANPPVSAEEAREASEAMARKGSVFPDEHLAFLLHHIVRGRLAAREEEQAARRRARAERHLKDLAEREQMREEWNQLPEVERSRIRELVLRDYATPPPGRFVQMLCIERLREIHEEGHGR
jgi:hypothetical protein